MAKRKAASTVSFVVLGDKIAVELDTAEEVTEGGIVMPDIARDKNTSRGTVVAVGPGPFVPQWGKRLPLGVSVGDRLVFEQYVGNRIAEGDKLYRILREQDILAVLPPKDE